MLSEFVKGAVVGSILTLLIELACLGVMLVLGMKAGVLIVPKDNDEEA